MFGSAFCAEVVEKVGPCLQHLATVLEVTRVIIGASRAVLISMSQLALYSITVVAKLVEDGAAGSAGGMGAVLSRRTKLMESLAKSAFNHRLVSVVPVRKDVLVSAVDGLHAPKYLDSLPRSGTYMRLAHLHSVGGNPPKVIAKVNFSPSSAHGLVRPAQRQPHKHEGTDRLVVAVIVSNGLDQIPNSFAGQWALVLRFVGRQRPAQGADRILL